jgi:hypothetical protein
MVAYFLAGESGQRFFRPAQAAVHQFVGAQHDRKFRAALLQAEFAAAGDAGAIELHPGDHRGTSRATVDKPEIGDWSGNGHAGADDEMIDLSFSFAGTAFAPSDRQFIWVGMTSLLSGSRGAADKSI